MSTEVMNAAVVFAEQFLDINESVSTDLQLCVTDYLSKDVDHRGVLMKALNFARQYNSQTRDPVERKKHLRQLIDVLKKIQDLSSDRQHQFDDIQDMINVKMRQITASRIQLERCTRPDDADTPSPSGGALGDQDIETASSIGGGDSASQTSRRGGNHQPPSGLHGSGNKKKRPRMSSMTTASGGQQPPSKRPATSSKPGVLRQNRLSSSNRASPASHPQSTGGLKRSRPGVKSARRKDPTSTPGAPLSSLRPSDSPDAPSSLSGRRGDRPQPSSRTGDNDDGHSARSSSPEPFYCVCNSVSYGEMIACDNDKCPIEWFHFICVDVRARPKGKWFCPKCRGDSVKLKRPDA